MNFKLISISARVPAVAPMPAGGTPMANPYLGPGNTPISQPEKKVATAIQECLAPTGAAIAKDAALAKFDAMIRVTQDRLNAIPTASVRSKHTRERLAARIEELKHYKNEINKDSIVLRGIIGWGETDFLPANPFTKKEDISQFHGMVFEKNGAKFYTTFGSAFVLSRDAAGQPIDMGKSLDREVGDPKYRMQKNPAAVPNLPKAVTNARTYNIYPILIPGPPAPPGQPPAAPARSWEVQYNRFITTVLGQECFVVDFSRSHLVMMVLDVDCSDPGFDAADVQIAVTDRLERAGLARRIVGENDGCDLARQGPNRKRIRFVMESTAFNAGDEANRSALLTPGLVVSPGVTIVASDEKPVNAVSFVTHPVGGGDGERDRLTEALEREDALLLQMDYALSPRGEWRTIPDADRSYYVFHQQAKAADLQRVATDNNAIFGDRADDDTASVHGVPI